MTVELFKKILNEENLIIQEFMVKNLILNKLVVKEYDNIYLITSFVTRDNLIRITSRNMENYITLSKKYYKSHSTIPIKLENKYYFIEDLK